ncbi:MAG: CbiM family transporter [Proteobacteria bacterium]|nr:CbiM family transporter [Pseudomonadota bacterium]MBU1741774.1 CbiM family transporter [Pseudomonadota bacterium]
MHIADGPIKDWWLLAPSWLLGGAGVAWGLYKLRIERLPHVAVLGAAFFVASLIHLKFGATSFHPVLSGLIGALLGWAAVPVIFVGLTLQCLLFSHGGLSVLGLNTFNMAGPAVAAHFVFRRWMFGTAGPASAVAAFLCGATPIVVSSWLIFIELWLVGDALLGVAVTQAVVNLVLAVAEGFLTAMVIGFLKRVHSPLLGGYSATP